jgi:hypothetical protein
MLEISNSIFDVRRVEVMVRVLMMRMIVVFVMNAFNEGTALHNIIDVVATRPCGRFKFLGHVGRCLFPCIIRRTKKKPTETIAA